MPTSEDTRTAEAPPDPTVEPGLAPPERAPDRRRLVDAPTAPEVEGDEDEDDDGGEDDPTELTMQERADFASLLTCGRRSKTVEVLGHPVVVQTLTTADEMRIGLFTKKYLDSQLGFQRAYQVAVCAAGIREVQGRPLFTSLFEVTDDEAFDKKVEEVKKLYPIVVTQVYQAIMDLEREFAELAIKLGKLSG